MIGVALLGSGFMGSTHAAAYRELGDRVRVRAVYSSTAESARRVAGPLGARAATDLAETLADPAVDVVDVCLPTALHREAVERAFAAGKHVLLEKPISLTLADADAIVAAAKRSDRILMVGLVLRFWPEYVELARRISAGELGRPLALSAHRLSQPPDWSDWIADPERSGGVPIDLMVHDFDQANWLLGRPRSVLARGDRKTHVHALVEYECASALVEGSLAMPGSYPFSSSIRVACEHGVAAYAFSAAPAESGGNIGAPTSESRLRLYPSAGDASSPAVRAVDPWLAEIQAFVDCVERNRPPEQGTGEQARLALAVSLAASRSLDSGRVELV